MHRFHRVVRSLLYRCQLKQKGGIILSARSAALLNDRPQVRDARLKRRTEGQRVHVRGIGERQCIDRRRWVLAYLECP